MNPHALHDCPTARHGPTLPGLDSPLRSPPRSTQGTRLRSTHHRTRRVLRHRIPIIALSLSAACLALAAAPASPAADPPGDRSADQTSANRRAATDKTSTAIFVTPARGSKLSAARKATLLSTMERALGEDERLRVVDRDVQLAARAGLMPSQRIAEARTLRDRGESSLADNRTTDAVADLTRAAELLEETLTYSNKRDLARAQFLLGAALVAEGKSKEGEKLFVRLLVWRPDFIDARLPSVALSDLAGPVWRKAQDKVAKRRRGGLELVTEPPGALAYVNGQFFGFTPTSVRDLPTGTHYVTFKRNGYTRQVIPARVTRRTRAIEVTLQPSPGADTMNELAAEIGEKLDEEEARATIELGRLLSVDNAVFVEVPTAGSVDASYRAALFETRHGKRLRIVTVAAGEDTPLEELLGELGTSLYADLDLTFAPVEPVEVEPKEPDVVTAQPTPLEKSPRFYKRWWFWTAVGVAAAAAVAIPLLVTGGDDDNKRCTGSGLCGEVIWTF